MRLSVLVAALAVVAAAAAVLAVQAGQPAPVDEAKAAELYRSTCAACHMADGDAAIEPMNLADGKWRHGSSVKEIATVIREGVPGTAMMPFKSRFSEAEILALARYVRQFDKSLKPDPSDKKPASASK